MKIVIIDKSVMFYYKRKEKNETKTEDVRSGEVFVWFGLSREKVILRLFFLMRMIQ